jgi:hypothetical protein
VELVIKGSLNFLSKILRTASFRQRKNHLPIPMLFYFVEDNKNVQLRKENLYKAELKIQSNLEQYLSNKQKTLSWLCAGINKAIS